MNTHFLYCRLTNTALSSSPYNFNERSLIQYLDSGKPSTSENRQLTGILTSGNRLPPSTDQDAAHFLVYRKGFQGNDRAPCTRAPKRRLSYRDLDLRRGTFYQNPDKKALRYHYHAGAEEKLDKPRVVLGDGTRSTVQRSVQFRYCRWDIARMMKELDLNKLERKKNA
jgi:hypothetical protein